MAFGFTVLQVFDAKDRGVALYTLSKTHYGQLLFIFRQPSDELENFKQYAQRSLKLKYTIKTLVVVAETIDQVHHALQEHNLLPSGESRVVVEGTVFFDECIAQLMTDTIWE
jgi:hypothetical protein